MSVKEIRKLIEEMNLRIPKDHHKMNTKQLSGKLREVMNFEWNIFQKIEEFEKKGVEKDLTTYARVICKNTVERESLRFKKFILKKSIKNI